MFVVLYLMFSHIGSFGQLVLIMVKLHFGNLVFARD